MVTFRWYGVHRLGLSVVGTEFWNFGGPHSPAMAGYGRSRGHSFRITDRGLLAGGCGPVWPLESRRHTAKLGNPGEFVSWANIVGRRVAARLSPARSDWCLVASPEPAPSKCLSARSTGSPIRCLGHVPFSRRRMSRSHPSHGGVPNGGSRRFRHLRAESLTGATDFGYLRRLRTADWNASTTSDRAGCAGDGRHRAEVEATACHGLRPMKGSRHRHSDRITVGRAPPQIEQDRR
jgi:hypothetical protein